MAALFSEKEKPVPWWVGRLGSLPFVTCSSLGEPSNKLSTRQAHQLRDRFCTERNAGADVGDKQNYDN